jgi:hypothetical protein
LAAPQSERCYRSRKRNEKNKKPNPHVLASIVIVTCLAQGAIYDGDGAYFQHQMNPATTMQDKDYPMVGQISTM